MKTMTRACVVLGVMVWLSGCGSEATPTPAATPTPTAAEATPVDLRFELPPVPQGGSQYVTPDMIIPPYSERQFCYFFTYTGEDIGVNKAGFWQNADYGHHVIAMISNADPEVYQDGQSYDCTAKDSMPMTDMEPLVIPNVGEVGQSEMILPEGMATKLKSGSRMVMQSHYLNTSGQALLVRDVINFEYIPVDQVRTWAAPYAHVNLDFSLPPGQTTTVKVECTFDQDVYLLMLLGHMHEWGAAFSIEWDRLEGQRELLYDVPVWDPLMRDDPITYRYDEGQMLIRAGEKFITTCTWFNDTDHVIEFPEEMCVTSGMLYPSVVPLICETVSHEG